MLTGRSQQRARMALNQLEADGVLAQVTLGRRNRAWEMSACSLSSIGWSAS